MEELEAEEVQKTVDPESIIRCALRSSFTKVIELLKPDAILDHLEEAKVLSDCSRMSVRDIREQTTTSAKNRAIHAQIMRDPTRYLVFKRCLAGSRQNDLLDILEKAERDAHEEMTDNKQQRCCSSIETCPTLASLQFDKDLPACVTLKNRDIQRSLIQIYEDKCQHVPVFSMIPEVTEHLERLYVRPTMRIVDTRGRDIGLNSQFVRQTNLKELTVKSFKDIFYNDNKACRNVYITGDAGCGKSVFCDKLVHTWCKAHLRYRDSKECHLSEDEQIMVEFPLLFYISLRYASDDIDIERMICKQLSIDNAKELLETEKCLVILDGLDEWITHESEAGSRFTSKGIPRRNIKSNATVLTTSRPWKLEKLRLKENEIDIQINIAELSKMSVDELTGRILSVMNETHGTKKQPADFIHFIEKSKLNDHLQTPVILSQMVCLWYYDIPFGKSECEIYSNMIDKQIEMAVEQKGLNIPYSGANDKMCSLPECVHVYKNITQYSTVLLSLSRLAFNMLLHEDRESSLVFDHKQTEIYGMSSSEVDICLSIGLLTQQKVFINFVKKSKSISFIHKTHQEFFAALYLASLDYKAAYHLLTSKGKRSLDTFLEMSKVLVFLNGMKSKLGDEILSHVREITHEDQRVLDYRASCSGPYARNYPVVKQVQYLITDCEIERQSNGLPVSNQQIDDLVALDNSTLLYLMNHWDVLKPMNASSVSVLTWPGKHSLEDMSGLWNRSFDCARESKHLQKIYIFDSKMCLDVNNIYRTITDTSSTLTCLVLCSVNLSGLGSALRDVLTMPHLRTLGLGEFVNITHQQLDIISEFLLEANNIQELRLKKITCLTHSKNNADCNIVFDVSRNNALRKLCVAGRIDKILIDASNLVILEARFMDVPGVTKNLLESLNGSETLTELELTSEFNVDQNAMIKAFPGLKAVRQLRLLDMDFTNMPLKLPKSMKQLDFVMLQNIKMDNASLRNMLDDLPTQRVEIWIGNTNMIDDTEDNETIKDYIRTSDKFEITLDNATWIYFYTVCSLKQFKTCGSFGAFS